MDPTKTYSEHITDTVLTWPGVTAGVGRRGEWAFRVGGREIGHLHGNHVAHFAFPRAVWSALFEAGRVTRHPVFPDKVGWAQRRIDDGDDVDDVIDLLRANYDRAVTRQEGAAALRS